MSQTKHTPGPWAVDQGGFAGLTTFIKGRDGEIVATVEPQLESSLTESRNAHLISAAPDMLAALIEARDIFQASTLGLCPKSVLYAIAKAEGRES